MRKRKPTRLKHYNYSIGGYYFITICTNNHSNLFGSIVQEKVRLNQIGNIVRQKLKLINELYENVEIDDYYIIMPNHLHFILIIDESHGDDKDRTKMYVSKIIQQFKSACTKEIRSKLNLAQKIWQKSYYDRIIRNEKELFNIQRYIEQNPLKWDIEKTIPENLEM